ncbi:hypothetical protein T4B_5790 [Trichinella pseudospiralis]|uniref:Uncharacterized protein n=2 Tax=Trichinella pseudospiralis TaxID=6337 RepID=A0A0V1FVN8_TRIPS|nr:hypothetical protein T4A_8792 [Trichinella pseudospiralis]KRY90100.1 hypothetical protein T4D_15267 [Trichinella pseudospiralis]KRZ20734.1 hypothetical protein T4B_5790 [Trichinella pseudospiralis]
MKCKQKETLKSVVSIHGPLGYGPSTLPLRHSAVVVKRELKIPKLAYFQQRQFNNFNNKTGLSICFRNSCDK